MGDLSVFASLIALAVSVAVWYEVEASRRVARKEIERWAAYRREVDHARAMGLPPPAPPNRVVRW